MSLQDREALQSMASCDDVKPSIALRARIVLACADGLDNNSVARIYSVDAHTVSKWRNRYMNCGITGLLDMPRSGAPRKIEPAKVLAVVESSAGAPGKTLSIRGVARESNVSPSSVARIWRASGQAAARPAHKAMHQSSHNPDSQARSEADSSHGGSSADLTLAFHMAPVGLLVSTRRTIVSCNEAFSKTFGYSLGELSGRSLECLYPSHDEFQHIGERAVLAMRKTGFYSDERIMRRVDGSLFWCHVSGRSIDHNDPFASAIWSFEDISAVRRVVTELTQREREVAQLLVTGRSSKQIARDLRISHRTVEAHRARLMRKYGVATVGELIGRLVGGHWKDD
ncbi:LuxR C-terminal-related transcriptional regulator [Paraburkholderia sp. EG287B]|uniref:LuxR C-terminal-related transcriptional regulator n=1 Tax=Paraburkholderia sp. EG287B TaxID=3237010 RepID=UPI0034D28EAD